MGDSIHVLNHPLIQAKLSVLRDARADVSTFQRVLEEISMLMVYEVTRFLPVREVEVRTPLEVARSSVLDVDQLVCVAILRAALGMLQGVRRLIPDVRVGFIGMERDEKTLEPHFYYAKVPAPTPKQACILLDPMLATGGTAVASCDRLKEEGYKNLHFMCLVAAPEGVRRLGLAHPDVPIHAAALDRELNDRGYILPGLGDAGDRIFGT